MCVSDEKLVFQSKYQSSFNAEPSEVLQIQENLDTERRALEKKQANDLTEFDKKIILKLDQQVKDQQATLERAGVPGIVMKSGSKSRVRVPLFGSSSGYNLRVFIG